jgi:NAD(P)H-hydrate epimerase
MKVFSVAEMLSAEMAADALGVTYEQMMETAGRAVAEAVIARYPVAGANVLVLVGPGNNGGDGLVAGRHLAGAGADVAFYLYRPRDRESDPAFARAQDMGLFLIEATFDQRFRVLRTRLNITDILIDALLGTGVTRPIEGEMATMMRQVKAGIAAQAAVPRDAQRPFLTSTTQIGNDPGPASSGQSAAPIAVRPLVVAVDCPSGLNCDTGSLDRLAIPAQLTVTFGGPKRGHFRFPGAAACGELVVADIGIGASLPEVAAVKVELVTAPFARSLLPQRPSGGHKGTFGTALIAAGSSHYWGAPVLAARAAYRVGAGLVALAVPEQIRPTMAAQLPEATFPPVTDREILAEASALWLRQQVRARAMLVGPGMGDATAFLKALLAVEGAPPLPPLVVDADGLNTLAGMPGWAEMLPPGTILTPHPGEMARLMGIPLAELQEQDRVAVAQQQAAKWAHVVLLKGAYTVIARPDGSAHILPFANAALGTAGSGDVLAGVIVGLLAQGMAAYEATLLGGYLHAAAGQLASVSIGDAGLLAGEIADWLPVVRRRLQEA